MPKGSAASRAGLLGSYRRDDGGVVLGDVITGINGDAVNTDLDLFRAIDKYAPGESVTVVVQRLVENADGRTDVRETRLTLTLQATEAA